ncbi:MAG: hypothetical protein KatS3mg123_0167 [Burkholderiales bacterium]|nr:MAG: hypothetical protein KatS3mg123_0167 [Burkholderiales bacterium]
MLAVSQLFSHRHGEARGNQDRDVQTLISRPAQGAQALRLPVPGDEQVPGFERFVTDGGEGLGIALDEAVVVAHRLQRRPHLWAVGGSGKIDGAGEDVGKVVGMAEPHGRQNALGAAQPIAALQGSEDARRPGAAVADQGKGLNDGKVHPMQGLPGQRGKIAAGHAPVGQNGALLRLGKLGDFLDQLGAFAFVGNEHDRLGARLCQTPVLGREGLFVPVEPMDADAVNASAFGKIGLDGALVAPAPTRVGKEETYAPEAAVLGMPEEAGDRPAVPKGEAEHVVGVIAVVDDVVGGRPGI